MKKLLTFVSALALLLCTASVCCAQQVGVSVNGEPLAFDVPPVIEEGRTLVPIRALSEYFKYDVSWDGEEKRVDISNADEKLTLYIDKQEYYKNDEKKLLDVPAKIISDRTFVPLRLVTEEFGCEVNWNEEQFTAELIKYNVVEARTPYELISAVGDYTKIILTGEKYNLSELDEVTLLNSAVYKSDELYTGAEYIVREVENLVIEAPQNAEITIKEPYANVITFDSCANITLKNITAGHEVEKGSCIGGVIKFVGTYDAGLENCRLYGCGTYGVITEGSGRISVADSEIYECTYGLVELYDSFDVSFENCILRDSEGFDMIAVNGCENVAFKSCTVKNNVSDAGEGFNFITQDQSICVEFIDCTFENNSYYEFVNSKDVIFENCKTEE